MADYNLGLLIFHEKGRKGKNGVWQEHKADYYESEQIWGLGAYVGLGKKSHKAGIKVGDYFLALPGSPPKDKTMPIRALFRVDCISDQMTEPDEYDRGFRTQRCIDSRNGRSAQPEHRMHLSLVCTLADKPRHLAALAADLDRDYNDGKWVSNAGEQA